jgi:hypothetical protein
LGLLLWVWEGEGAAGRREKRRERRGSRARL